MRTRLVTALIGALVVAGAQAAEPQSRDGSRDFDFWMGAWKIHNRRLRERLKGSQAWDEFEATCVARPLLGGAGNQDVYRTDFDGGFTGMSFRFHDSKTGLWSIYWASSRAGRLEPPVVGSFEGDVGVFEGDDVFEGRKIRVRYTWSAVSTKTPRWEQAFSDDGGKSWETNWVMDMTRDDAVTSKDFPVVELRRYEVRPEERERFARYFDAYIPEAFQQIGFVALGQFLERKRATGFTWMRGYPSYDARAEMTAEFYGGPVWRELAPKFNDRIVDIANVLLLQPLAPGRGLAVPPVVDVVLGAPSPPGVVVLQILPVKPGETAEAARKAEEAFAAYRAAGAREAGLLVTLDLPNNYPRLPVREDGPFLVWVGVVPDDATLEAQLAPVLARSSRALVAQGHLRGAPEIVVLDPTPGSRLRFRPEAKPASR
jgi:hypothetical protein